ncbi:MAG: amidohydrolase family protein [Vicinamibacterales bacterium]
MLVSGPGLGITGGHCDNNLLPAEFLYKTEGVADGPWGVRAKVREVVKYGADVIKICASGGVLSKGDQPGAPQYTLEEMQAIVDEAHKLGRKVAAHAHGAQSIKDAIRAGIDPSSTQASSTMRASRWRNRMPPGWSSIFTTMTTSWRKVQNKACFRNRLRKSDRSDESNGRASGAPIRHVRTSRLAPTRASILTVTTRNSSRRCWNGA